MTIVPGEVALEREVDGDLFLQDIGQGFGFRPGSFDGAIRCDTLEITELRAGRSDLYLQCICHTMVTECRNITPNLFTSASSHPFFYNTLRCPPKSFPSCPSILPFL